MQKCQDSTVSTWSKAKIVQHGMQLQFKLKNIGWQSVLKSNIIIYDYMANFHIHRIHAYYIKWLTLFVHLATSCTAFGVF